MIIASRPSCPEGWLPTLIQPVIQLVSLIYDGTTKAAGQLGIKILICKFHICYFKKYLRTQYFQSNSIDSTQLNHLLRNLGFEANLTLDTFNIFVIFKPARRKNSFLAWWQLCSWKFGHFGRYCPLLFVKNGLL